LRRKEISWLIGVLIFVLIIYFTFFGTNALKANAAIDINIHDTYFVLAGSHFILLFSVLIFLEFTFYEWCGENLEI